MNNTIELLAPVFNALDDGVYIVDDNYTIVFMNQAMVTIAGEGTGQKCHNILSNLDKPCPSCKSAEVRAGAQLHRELFIGHLDRVYDVIEMPFQMKDSQIWHLAIYRDITRRKKRESLLRASADHFRQLFEHVGCGVFISSREGKFLDANQALLDMLGYSDKSEFLQIDLSRDLYVKPEHRQKFRELIERDGRVVDYEVEFKRKDGRVIPVLLTGHVRYDEEGNIIGYEGINVDQTQRKDMEKELREAHDFLNKIIQSSTNAIMAADMTGNIILWNQAAEDTLGYRAEEVIGKINIVDIYPEGMARKVMKLLRSPENGGAGKLRPYPILFVSSDGRVVEGNLSAAIIYDEQGNELASVGIFVDLEERLAMERKLRQTQEQLLQSEKLAAMGRLTSQIAHEINNPLYGIMNTLELLKTEVPPQNKRRKLLDMSLSEIMRLSDMLRKMLSFSRPDQEERKSININTVLDEIVMLHAKQLQENSIRIVLELASELPTVFASTNQLRQVFLNMLSNARDAMPEGGTLTVTTRLDQTMAAIDIGDTGVGIREENMQRIFDAFFSTKESVKGVGLGLSVCYGFITEHGGDIKVRSKPGEGTVFTITLPVEAAV